MKDKEKLPPKVQKAMNPTSIHKDKLTAHDLEVLGNEEELILQHPKIKGVVLKIRKDWRVESFLGSPVALYGENYVVSDNADRVYPNHDVLYNKEEMLDYLEGLLEADNLSLYYYYRNLGSRKLKPGDVIEFEDGKKGVIAVPEGDTFPRNIVFIPLKKDGTLSKVKPRYIYANTNYQKIEKKEG